MVRIGTVLTLGLIVAFFALGGTKLIKSNAENLKTFKTNVTQKFGTVKQETKDRLGKINSTTNQNGQKVFKE